MTGLAHGLDGGARERKETKVTPGFFTYSVARGEGVVRTSLRRKILCKVWEDFSLATLFLAVNEDVYKFSLTLLN